MAQVLRDRICVIQVCVSAEWPDGVVELFAHTQRPPSRWRIYRNGPDPERVVCAEDPTKVHVLLER